MLCSKLTRAQSNNLYTEVLQAKDTGALRKLCREDLFFLLTIGCKREDINKDWLYERCREIEAEPNGYLDLWAREHYKSTIITFGKSIQDILIDPNVTIGIFSHTRPIAKKFLSQIKIELEQNTFLKNLFPEILYQAPHKESPKWSLDTGLLVKRTSNAKEMTVEAWGLVDGQPTSAHFNILVYDDVVTKESVTNPDMIEKTTGAWELSLNLGARGGVKRHIGTRYHFNDTYRVILERGAAQPRIYPATHDGTLEGCPVFLSRKELDEKRRDQGPYTFACQQLQNPTADKAMGFREEWLRFYDRLGDTKSHWNYYILVDPANEKKKTSDYTVISVIGLAPDNNYYLIDGVRDRLNLRERTSKLFELVRKYKPIKVGYEKYGIQADIEHIEYVMELENYRFEIMPLGGSMAKSDRIKRLVPIFSTGRFWLPHKLMFIDYEGKARDFVSEFLRDEFTAFPVAVHDDMLDCFARVLDIDLKTEFPEEMPHHESITYRKVLEKVRTDYDLFARP